jgi:hypothetical protein
MSWLILAAIAVAMPLLTFGFGWAVLGRLIRLDCATRFAASFGVGFAFLGLLQLAAFAFGLPQPWFSLLAVAVMSAVALLLRRPSPAESPRDGDRFGFRPWVAGLLLVYGHLLCLQILLPDYLGSRWYNDWWMHFEQAAIFVGDKPVQTVWFGIYNLASRTPLFNLTTAAVMELAGHEFWVYQAASVLPNSCFALAMALLLRDLFGGRAAWLGLLLAPINLWLMHLAWFTWPKMLCAYYVLLGLHFYLQSLRLRGSDPVQASRLFLAFWTSSLLGYLTHQAAILFALPLVIHWAVATLARPEHWPRRAEWIGFGVLPIVLVFPWYAYLILTLGWTKVLHSTPVTASVSLGLLDRLKPAVMNIGASLFPIHLSWAFRSGSQFEWVYRGLTEFYFSLITGAVTATLTLYLLCVWVHRSLQQVRSRSDPKSPSADPPIQRGWRERLAVALFGVLGVISATLLLREAYPHGIAHAAFFPAVQLLLVIAWGEAGRARPLWMALVLAGMVLEFVLMWWSHLWLLHVDSAVIDPFGADPSLQPHFYFKSLVGAVFLCDRAGALWYVALGGAVLIEGTIVVLLVRFVWSTARATDR